MHMLLVILGGVLLLSVFTLFGRLWWPDIAGVVTGAKLFIPVWFVITLLNMWIGINRAGYTIAQELPILVVVFVVPASIAAVVIWQLAKS